MYKRVDLIIWWSVPINKTGKYSRKIHQKNTRINMSSWSLLFSLLCSSISMPLFPMRCTPADVSQKQFLPLQWISSASGADNSRCETFTADEAQLQITGPWVVVHFVWQTNTDGWPCSTHDKMFSNHNCQRLQVCNLNWGSVRKGKLLLKCIVWILCLVCKLLNA